MECNLANSCWFHSIRYCFSRGFLYAQHDRNQQSCCPHARGRIVGVFMALDYITVTLPALSRLGYHSEPATQVSDSLGDYQWYILTDTCLYLLRVIFCVDVKTCITHYATFKHACGLWSLVLTFHISEIADAKGELARTTKKLSY